MARVEHAAGSNWYNDLLSKMRIAFVPLRFQVFTDLRLGPYGAKPRIPDAILSISCLHFNLWFFAPFIFIQWSVCSTLLYWHLFVRSSVQSLCALWGAVWLCANILWECNRNHLNYAGNVNRFLWFNYVHLWFAIQKQIACAFFWSMCTIDVCCRW